MCVENNATDVITVAIILYGPVMLRWGWAPGWNEPLHRLTKRASADAACRWFAKRCRIETFWSDQHSRGFPRHQSHRSDPTRLARWLIAACLAYLWSIYRGALCEQDG